MKNKELDYCFHFEIVGRSTLNGQDRGGKAQQKEPDSYKTLAGDFKRDIIKRSVEKVERLKSQVGEIESSDQKSVQDLKDKIEIMENALKPPNWDFLIADLLKGFVHEEIDREDMQLRSSMKELRDAQIMAFDMLVNFFSEREDEKFHTLVFQSEDKKHLFLCVRFHEQSALHHAEQSRYLVQLDESALQKMGIVLKPKTPHNTAFLPFIPFLRKGGLLRKYCPESLPQDEKQGDKKHGDIEAQAALEAQRVHFLRKVDRIRLLYDRATDIVNCNAMKRWKLMKDYFPLHSHSALTDLRKTWGAMRCILRPQPINKIQGYFGSEIAVYFLFVGMLCMYTLGLIAATCGITALVYIKTGSIHDTVHQFLLGSKFHYHRMAQAVVTLLWFQVFVCHLRQRINWYMNQWGDDFPDTSDVKKLENEHFDAPAMPSEVDAAMLSYEATMSQRQWRSALSAILTFMYTVFAVWCVGFIFRAGAYLDRSGGKKGFSMAGYAVSAQIKILSWIWRKLSLWLAILERHQYAASFNSSRALKTFIFSAINAFASFFYVAFAMQFTEGCPADYEDGCWGYLCHQMIVVFAFFVGFTVFDIAVPYGTVLWAIRTSKKKRKECGPKNKSGRNSPAESLSFLELQAQQVKYGGDEQIQDYCQIVMPLAFVLMFGITLPFCSVLSLVCFALQLRADAFKLTRAAQRPFPSRCIVQRRGGALGVWMVVLQLLACLATVTNSALIVFNLEPFKSWQLNNQLVLFYTFILAALTVQIVLQALIPDISAEVALARRRHDRQRSVVASLAHHCGGQLPENGFGETDKNQLVELWKEIQPTNPVKLCGNHKNPTVGDLEKIATLEERSEYFIAAD